MLLEKLYFKAVKKRFEESKKLGDETLERISNSDIHWQPNEESNNIAIIVKHISGNMISRWTEFLTTDGEKPNRHRDQEFEDTISSVEELSAVWEKGWEQVFETLNSLQAEDLVKTVYIRGEEHNVIEAIERQIAHVSYHVGQIVYIGKVLKGKEWESLSIPIGKSEEYLQELISKNNSK
ncbi:DUF1572 family protein [Rummeliibacillus pycnus]|uniref:DUF1572 family protein n=1 Tax=Rummeliibacillus pycnus TaxID=101070 RepID=UPI003D277D7A